MAIFIYTFIFIMTLCSVWIVLYYAAPASPLRKAQGIVNNVIHWGLCALAYAYFPIATVVALVLWVIAVIAMIASGFDIGASIRRQYGIKREG